MAINPLELLDLPNKERLSDQIARQIKKLIYSRKLVTGQKLPSERELAQSLKVSRVVVRESLRFLEHTGFVEIKTGHTGGAFVSNKIYKPIIDSIYDLLEDGDLSLTHFVESRAAIEVFSIQQAVRNVDSRDIDDLHSINRQLLEDMDNNEQFPYHNMEFHVKIAEISKNPLVKMLVTALLNILIMIYPKPYQSSEFIKKAYDAHQAIITAMHEKNVLRCETLMQQDVGLTRILLDF